MAAIPCLKLKRSLPGVELGGNAYQAILRRAEDGVGRESVTSSYSIRVLSSCDSVGKCGGVESFRALYSLVR